MIGRLCGLIVDKEQPGKFVIDVNGVGYDVDTSMNTFFKLEPYSGAITLHIHTVVREDAFLLFGFAEKSERSLFRELLKVNGIGPKVAIAILSSTTPEEFVQCINQQDITKLTKLPGVGKKTAERLAIEMKDRVHHWSKGEISVQAINHSAQDEATKALEALGYKQKEALNIIKRVDDGQMSCEQLIRSGLQLLSTSIK